VLTLEQIEELHGRLGTADTLTEDVRSLAALGVARYGSFVSDGHSEYVGGDAHRVTSHAVHDELTVATRDDCSSSCRPIGALQPFGPQRGDRREVDSAPAIILQTDGRYVLERTCDDR
jgi:hypothetical protein